MRKLHKISVDGESFSARSGQILLDAALVGGVELPHDCRAGRCGACLTRIKQGITLGGESRQPGLVHACQARVFSDLSLEVEPTPPVDRIRSKVVHIAGVGQDIVEVAIAPDRMPTMLPGQYCRLAFRGFPARPFSPTAPMSAIEDDGLLRFHIKQVRDGRVTPQIGQTIGAKHPVVIEGPFGHAFLRAGRIERLVLVGSGTGFAPIWALAAAALRENPDRQIVLVAACRRASAFYMAPTLELAAAYSNVSVIAVVEELGRKHRLVKSGPTVDHLPEILPDDIVYAAGGPRLVDAVGEAAQASNALFYSDPFEPMTPTGPSWLDTARGWLKVG